MSPESALDALDAPLRRTVELAWDAHQLGNVGVGAVLTDPAGVIVVEGRNRARDTSAPSGHLYGTFLAHAEIDVLGRLPPGDHLEHTLWTSLQPCLLCTSATVLTKIGHVRYLAPDPLWDGIERLPELNAQTARRWPTRTGPGDGPIRVFAQMLPTLWFVGTDPPGASVETLARSAPAAHVLMHRIVADGADQWSTLTLVDALAEIWDDLVAAV